MRSLYYNGIIYGKNYQVFNSMIVENELIYNIGNDLDDVVDEKIDLKGLTVLPSFLDAHSHLTSLAMSFLQLDLGNCCSIEMIKEALRGYCEKYKPSMINAINYDHNRLQELRHPSKDDIDQIVSDIPVVLVHNSNHFGVFNTKAIEILKLNTDNGFLKETEFVEAVKKMPLPSISDIIKCYDYAQKYYASFGITYVQDGMIVKEMLPIYERLLDSDLLYLDVFGYPNILEKDNICQRLENINNHFHISGYKIILDGSPQGKTAWMLTPYINSSDCSEGLVSNDDLIKYIEICINDKKQLLAHCNGDAASQQLINCAKKFEIKDLEIVKPVIVHAQLLNVNQLYEVYSLKMIPSFFVAHVYHFGDIHIENFGFERASKISPANSCLKKDIKFTFHQDTPVIKPDMFETIQISIERITKAGIKLGYEESISLKDAINALTLNVAYQYGIENECGSLENGKKASFIIIDKDIFKTDVKDIKNIKVLKTYKDGKCIFEL